MPESDNILEREKYYIQKYYKENPDKSLNIACTNNLDIHDKNSTTLFEITDNLNATNLTEKN